MCPFLRRPRGDKAGPRPHLPAALRQALRVRDDYRCRYCGSDLAHEPGDGVLDHIVPRSCGGLDCPVNLALACLRCDRRKGARPAERLMDMIAHDRPADKSRG